MGKDGPNSTIRILMLGNAGVGKNCLESRFTTMTYPPPYNPALTLNSRRYFTLPPVHAVGDCEAEDVREPRSPHSDKNTRRKDAKKVVVAADERPRTTSSTATMSSSPAAVDLPAVDHPDNASFDDRTLVASSTTTASSLCSACARENNTYLVEVINYPDLQSAAVRRHVHARADYDAVLLVYDVCDAASFDAIPTLHGEIPVCTRTNHHQHHRRALPHASATRSRTSGWFGGGGNETGTTGSGEIVVGLVGNKSDVDDADEDKRVVGDNVPGDVTMTSAVQDSDPAEESLLHPLYRESILYEELTAQREQRERRKVARATARAEARARTAQTPTTPFPTGEMDRAEHNDNTKSKAGLEAAAKSKNDDIQKWLEISRPEPSLPLSPLSPSPRSPRSPMHDGDGDDDDDDEYDYFGLAGTVADIKPRKPKPTKAPRVRQVPAADGTMLAQALQLSVPFLETSAQTGRHVEHALENLVRAVLREMGRDASGTNKAGKTCRHRERLPKKDKDKPEERRPSRTFVSLASPIKGSMPAPAPAPAAATTPVSVRVPPLSAPPTPSEHDIAAQRPESAAMFRQPDADVGPLADATTPPAAAVDPDPAIPPPPIQRRASVMGRMRNVFWRKSQQPAEQPPGGTGSMPANIAV
ncbi:uncharacterized protein SPSK_03167 [Sporothrix schenckii 1099-18]|uniref:small monomeric GTPase n=1 Tax=Sporothrix schenckii 1099-18 TaxID=1397361 RepID=A0A0F2LYM0_SPOSC|nr:uncharacterized protein SPSK_03167 [Sporothrix schenckii 1099-18]KJR81934.1 hypothetical protein SPSK_03167 [Sporothrix schenckii 1099-18]